MGSFIRRDFVFERQCEADVVQPIEQAMTTERSDFDFREKAVRIGELFSFQIGCHGIRMMLRSALEEFLDFFFTQTNW